MIAYIVGTCAKDSLYNRSRSRVKIYARSAAVLRLPIEWTSPSPVSRIGQCPYRGRALLQEHAGAADLLAAQRAEKIGHDAVHQLEIGRERRRVLLRVVQNLLAARF